MSCDPSLLQSLSFFHSAAATFKWFIQARLVDRLSFVMSSTVEYRRRYCWWYGRTSSWCLRYQRSSASSLASMAFCAALPGPCASSFRCRHMGSATSNQIVLTIVCSPCSGLSLSIDSSASIQSNARYPHKVIPSYT